MFLGYSTTQKGYKCFDPTNNRTLVSRDVRFLEDQGYYEKAAWDDLKDLAASSDKTASLRMLIEHLGDPINRNHNRSDASAREAAPGQSRGQAPQPTVPDRSPDRSHDQEDLTGPVLTVPDRSQDWSHDQEDLPGPVLTVPDRSQDRSQDQDESPDAPVSAPTSTHAPITQSQEEIGTCEPISIRSGGAPQPLRRSSRLTSHPHTWREKRVFFNNIAEAHPIQAVCSLALLPHDHQVFLGKIDQDIIPQSYEEATESKEWMDAVEDEVGAMTRNHTWDEADLPHGKRAVSSKWVFTIKHLSNGDIERYKARLVARGFTQTYGEDFTDTFAPVAKLHTVRVILSLATNLDWDLWQMDVKNAFLQGELEEEVYMTPPPGLESSITPGKVLRLRKAIYGLKQSPRAWYHKLSSTLKSRGFRKSESDHTLFTLHSPKGRVVVLIYVDDLIVTGDDRDGIQEAKAFLKSVFDIKDLGELKYFLGIEVYRQSDGLFISQRKYTHDLLKEMGKLDARPAKTPLEDGYKVDRKGEKEDEPFDDMAKYRRIVGKLIYLTLTRPDICFAVNQASQHMQAPTIYHWTMVDRILRYLKGSSGQGIWMGKNNNTDIVGYCDADWAGDRMDRRSTTGYCTFIGGNLVTWKTKKQKVVSCSSAEAEYRAMKKLTNELTWLKGLLACLGISHPTPITMHCDNQAAIHIATNSVFHERTKHIEVDCHKVREKIEQGVTLPCFTRSEDQLADIFTKAASLKVCDHIHGKLGLVY